MITFLAAFAFALYLAIAVMLARKYWRTHDVGLVWLGVAVVIWPLVSSLLERGARVFIDRLTTHQSIGFYPFNLVERGDITLGMLTLVFAIAERLIGILLLLIAVFYLYRANERRAIPN